MEENRKIGQYEITAELSHGSITSVYKAYQPSLKRQVLIKRLHQKLVNEADIRERFNREAQVCAQINHPNIVSIFDFQSGEEGTYLVMEFISGSSLGELLKGKPFPISTAVTVMTELLKGLRYAHEKGVIHRDIKPDNILLSETGQVKISDFGLAIFEGATSLTMQGMVVGTPAYMSPEQASGRKMERNSDIFSMGIVFFEMLTGVNPYKADSFSLILKRIISDPAPRLEDYLDEYPEQLDKIMNRMLEKNPGRRYQNCEEILEDFKLVEIDRTDKSDKEIVKDLFRGEGLQKASQTVKLASSITRRRRKLRNYLIGGAGIIIIAVFILYVVAKNYRTDAIKPADMFAQDTASIADAIAEDTLKSEPQDDKYQDLKTAGKNEIDSAEDKRKQNTLQGGVAEKEVDKPEKAVILPSSGTEVKPIDVQEEKRENLNSPGELTITCFPWANVYIDDILVGQPPFAKPFPLSPGDHRLQFIRPDYPMISKHIYMNPGEKIILEMNLWEHVGVLKVSTLNAWAEIWIDGKLIDRTPRADPIIMSLGKHSIELRNPDFQIFQRELEFKEGDGQAEVLAVTLIPNKRE